MSQYFDPCQGTHLRWVVEGQVLLLDIQTESDREALLYDQMIMDQFNLASHSIDLIIKMPSSHTQPSFKHWMNGKYQQHPHLGHVIIVGAARGVSRDPKVRHAATLEDALSSLHV